MLPQRQPLRRGLRQDVRATTTMRGVLVLGPRGVALLAAVLVFQSGLIAYLLYPDSSRQLLPSCDDSSALPWPLLLPLDSPSPGRTTPSAGDINHQPPPRPPKRVRDLHSKLLPCFYFIFYFKIK
jgi:hypothetical protein